MNTHDCDYNRSNYADVAAVVDGLKAALSKQKGGINTGVKVKRLVAPDADLDLGSESGRSANCNRCLQFWWMKHCCNLHGLVDYANHPPYD